MPMTMSESRGYDRKRESEPAELGVAGEKIFDEVEDPERDGEQDQRACRAPKQRAPAEAAARRSRKSALGRETRRGSGSGTMLIAEPMSRCVLADRTDRDAMVIEPKCCGAAVPLVVRSLQPDLR